MWGTADIYSVVNSPVLHVPLVLLFQEGPAKANAKIQMAALFVVDLSFNYLGRHLDFGVRFDGTSFGYL
jgi:hypothetical protein